MPPDSTADLLAALAGRLERREPRPVAWAVAGRVAAGVAVPLHPGPRGLEAWMIKRPASMRQHAGEVAFPGGRPEPEDGGDLLETALRETVEELGLARADLRPLGALAPVPTATSTFLLHPFAVAVAPGAKALPHAGEVEVLIRVPLEDFLTGEVPYRAVVIGDHRLSPIFDLEAGSMFGASAHVLLELLTMYAEVRALRLPSPVLTDQIPWR